MVPRINELNFLLSVEKIRYSDLVCGVFCLGFLVEFQNAISKSKQT